MFKSKRDIFTFEVYSKIAFVAFSDNDGSKAVAGCWYLVSVLPTNARNTDLDTVRQDSPLS